MLCFWSSLINKTCRYVQIQFSRLLGLVADVNAERHERCRDYRQAWSTLIETARLGMSFSIYSSRCVYTNVLHSTFNRPVLRLAMVCTKD